MRKYTEIWNQLKRDGTVSYTVTKAGHRRIWNGIKKEKTIENVARRSVGLSHWRKLNIVIEELSATHQKVTLSFYTLKWPDDPADI